MLSSVAKLFVIVILLPFSNGIKAQDFQFDYSFFTRLGYSDNLVQLSPTPGSTVEEESGTSRSGGLNFSFNSARNNTLVANIEGEFSRTRFSTDELSSDNEKNFEASILYQPENRNFQLAILDTINQVELDRESSRSVNNVRDLHTFSVIPSYFVRMSPLSQINTDYRYTKTDDDDGLSSAVVNSATVGYQKQILSDVVWSINVRGTNTEFEDLDAEFDQEEVFLRLNGGGGRTLFDFQIGRQRAVNPDIEPENYSYQNAARLSINRQINSFSGLNLVVRQGFGDFLNVNLDNALVQISSNDQAGFIEGVVKEKQVTLDYSYNNRSLVFAGFIGTRSLEDDNEITSNSATIDEDENFLGFVVGDRILDPTSGRGALDYTFNYRYREIDFNLTDTEIKTNEAQIRLTYMNSEKLETFIELASRNVAGSGPGLREVDEGQVLIGLRFSPRGLR